MIQEQKRSLRQMLLQQRKEQPTLGDNPSSSEALITLLQTLPEWQQAQNVLLYAPLPSELNLLNLLSEILTHRFFFPRMEGQTLELYEWFPNAPWIVNTHRIQEPDPQEWRQANLEEIDLALIPGLAFDTHGGRLGWGRGYFDRLLSNPEWRAVNTGIAWPWQLVHTVPREEHDIAMDVVITPLQIYRPS